MNPSLLLIPDRYKASKLYSQIPADGAADLDFTRALDTATRVNSAGLIEAVGIDIPRIDYTGGGCGKLLLEPQRTNLIFFSEQLDNAYWTKTAATITANDAISPDGYINADKLVEDTSTGEHLLLRSLSLAAGTYTWGVFAKAAGRKYVVLRNNATGGAYRNTCFDLELGTIVFDGLGNAQIQSFGNGWFRITANSNETSVVARNYEIHLSDAAVLTNSAISYTGDGTSGILFYGVQLELGSYPTSYINTLGASVTRSADVASKTGISSLIGQTEGSIFLNVNLELLSQGGVLLTLSNGTFANFIILAINASNQIELAWRTNAGAVNVFTTAASAGRSKIGVGYEAGNIVFFVNGVLINTGAVDVNWSAPLSRLDLGNELDVTVRTQNHNIAALYPTRLTNAELATLTSL